MWSYRSYFFIDNFQVVDIYSVRIICILWRRGFHYYFEVVLHDTLSRTSSGCGYSWRLRSEASMGSSRWCSIFNINLDNIFTCWDERSCSDKMRSRNTCLSILEYNRTRRHPSLQIQTDGAGHNLRSCRYWSNKSLLLREYNLVFFVIFIDPHSLLSVIFRDIIQETRTKKR